MKGASIVILCCSLLSLGIGSCSPSLEQACRSQIPQLQQDLSEASRDVGREIASRDPEGFSAGPSRAIASVDASGDASALAGENEPQSPHRYFDLDPGEKSKWQDWSATRLKLVERYQDFARTQTQLEGARQPLSNLADDLVDFNGYAERGLLYQMRNSLRQAQTEADTAARLGCAFVSR